MTEFGIERFSDGAQTRMSRALADAGLISEPPLSAVTRSDTVVLTLESLKNGGGPSELQRDLASVVTVRAGMPSQTLRSVPLADVTRTSDDEVIWIDIADSGEVDVASLLAAASPLCGEGLTTEMLDDVLRPDPRPGVKKPDSDDEAVRCVSAFRATTRESDKGVSAGSVSKAGVLVFEPVEFLAGPNWLITCWHDIEIYRGVARIDERDPDPPKQVIADVVRSWKRAELRSGGDLAASLLRELSRSYMPAYQQFFDWQDEWELDFFRRADRIDRETLPEVRASAVVLREWLSPLRASGIRDEPEKAWFLGLSPQGHQIAVAADRAIDKCMDALIDFSNTLRSAYDLLQLRTQERERERDDSFQRNIAVWGAAILIPTLVAGIMGANTWVPGQWQEEHQPTHWDFVALLAIVLLSGAFAWAAIHWLQRKDDST